MAQKSVSTSSKQQVIAPGAHIVLRDAVWRVVRVDQTSSGKASWRCIPEGTDPVVKHVAPWVRCNREWDYEEVWARFEKRIGSKYP